MDGSCFGGLSKTISWWQKSNWFSGSCIFKTPSTFNGMLWVWSVLFSGPYTAAQWSQRILKLDIAISVVPEPGGPLAPPIFCRSVNPIQTREGRLSPPITTGPPNVFHLPASLQTLVGLCTTLQISTMGYCSYLSGVNQKCAQENNDTQ